MSNTVDNRVVSMRFDNEDFERNVAKSMKSIEKLNASIDSTETTKGFSNLSKAIQAIDMSPVVTAVEGMQQKFSALSIIGITALQNITNQAIATGERMIKALSIDQVTEGYKEYELKMGSVQTIMAGTGESLETVSEYLEELNHYADKTIYSFSDMTSNIGKFTNAGVKLNSAVKAIQGVSNVAAVSGANAQEASRAMYNFAQALSAGYVKLIDWKSIENANMATVEFKQQLIDTAVAMGTVVKTEQGYVSTTTDANGKVSAAFDATHNFNDALSNQWMTTKVLTQTLENYTMDVSEMTEEEKKANRERLKGLGYSEEQIDNIMSISTKANKAATEVKTFTQLMDTLKEAVGSSWATTSELLIGDFNEAKELYTNINDIIGDMISAGNDARNEVLQGWKDMGGRTVMLKALANAFNALRLVIEPVKEAFKEIFPEKTSRDLFELSIRFEEFTKKLRPSLETVDKIKRSFKGLFAVFDIVKNALGTLGKAVGIIIKHFGAAGGSVLDLSAGLGDFLVSLRNTIVEGNVFGLAMAKIVTVIIKMVDSIGNFVKIVKTGLAPVMESIATIANNVKKKIKSMFDTFGTNINIDGASLFATILSIISNGLSLVAERLGMVRKKIGEVFNTGFFSGLVNLLRLVWTVITTVGGVIFDVLGDIFKTINDGLANANFDTIFDLINGLLSSGLLFFLTKAAHSLADIAEPLGNLGDILEMFNMKIKAEALVKIATGIAILAGSLLVLSMIDSNKLTTSIMAMTAMFSELMLSMKKLTSFDGELKGLTKLGTALVLLSVSVSVMASALKKIASVDKEAIISATIALGAVTKMLVMAMKSLSSIEFSKMTSTAAGMILFAEAVNVLSKVVKKFGDMSPVQLVKGLIGVGIVLSELEDFMSLAKFNDLDASVGFSLLAVSGAVVILSKAVAAFASLDIVNLAKGIIALRIVLTELGQFTKLANGSEEMIYTGLGMIAMAAAINILTKSVETLAQLSVSELAKGLLGMSVALDIVTEAMNKIPTTEPIVGLNMIVMAEGLKILSNVLINLGSMDIYSIGKGLLALGVGLNEVVNAMNKMVDALPGAAALLVVSAAIAILTPQIQKLGEMSLVEIGKAMLALFVTFNLLAKACGLLGPVVPVIFELAKAIALIGVGVGVASAGLALLSAAVLAFATAGSVASTTAIAALTGILEGVAKAIPKILQYVGEGIVELAVKLGNSAPQLINVVLQLLDQLLVQLDEYVPKFVDLGLHMLTQTLQALTDNLPMVVDTAIQFVEAFLDGLSSRIFDIVDSAFQFVISFINGFADAIDKNNPQLVDAVDHLMNSIVTAIGQWLTGLVDIGADIVGGLVKGITDSWHLMIDKIIELGSSIIDKFKEVLGIHSPSKVFAKAAEYIGDGVVEGLDASETKVEGASESLASRVINSFKNAIQNGKSGLNGLGDELVSSLSATNQKQASAEDQKRKDMILAQQIQANTVTKEATKKTEDLAAATETQSFAANKSSKSTNKQAGSVKKLSDTLKGGISIFSKFNETASISSEEMLNNIKSNYDGVKSWTDNLKNLASRGINKNLLEKLTNLGVSGAATVKSFVEMTDDELKKAGSKYSKTFKMVGDSSLKEIEDYIKTGKNTFKEVYKSDDYTKASADIFTKTAKAYKDYAKTIGESLDPFSKFTLNTERSIKSTKDLTSAMKSQSKMTKTLQKAYASLAVAGLDKNYLAQIQEQTKQDQVEIISAILTGDVDKNIKEINKSYNNMMKSGYSFDSKVLAAIAEGNISEISDQFIAEIEENTPEVAKALNKMLSDAVAETDASELKEQFETLKQSLMDGISALESFEKVDSKNNTLGNVTKNLTENAKATSLAMEGWLRILKKGFSVDFVNIFRDLPINEQLAYQTDILKNATTQSVEEVTKAMKAKVEAAGGEMAKGYNTAMKLGIDRIDKSTIDKISDETEAIWFENVNSMVNTVIQTIPQIGEGLESSIDAFAKRLGNVTGSGVSAFTGTARKAFEDLGYRAIVAAGGLEDLEKALDGASTAEEKFKIYNEAINAQLSTMRSNLVSVIESQMDLFSKFNDAADVSAEDMLGNMRSQIDGIKNWQKNLDHISDMLNQTNLGEGLLKKLAELGPNAYETVAAFANMTSDQLKEAVGLFEESLTLPGTVADNIMGDYAEVGSNVADGLIKGVRDKATEITKAAEDTAGTYLNAIKSENAFDIHSPSKKMMEIGEFIIEGLDKGIKGKANTAKSTARSVASSIKSAFDSYTSQYYSVGMQMMNGIINGINAGRSGVINAAVSTAVAAYVAVISKLQIHSPSKLFAEVGMYVAEGFAKGIDDNANKVVNSAEDMADGTFTAMSKAISKVNEFVNDNIDTNPTITPILDLSNVRKGANEISGLFAKNAADVAASNLNGTNQNGGNNSGMTFIQNNYSPKSLNRIELYRQTKNQFAAAKGLVNA